MKKIINQNPFSQQVLTEEEMLLEEMLEKGEYEATKNFEETREALQKMAKNHRELNTSKPITIRINQLDLIKLKAKAKEKNIPYQTLLGVLIREYTNGNISLTL
jgi:predicted DNA binding CopG/RHH family protein